MSQNLDLVRSIYSAWERGDYSSVAWADPEIEYVMVDGPSPGSWTGVAGMAQGWRDFLSAWEDHRAQAEEYREIDDDRVLVFAHARGRGKTSGMELGPSWVSVASLFEVRRGRVARLVVYLDRDHALADLGLAPEGEAK
jgi:ketosteroid isomerase-like protein